MLFSVRVFDSAVNVVTSRQALLTVLPWHFLQSVCWRRPESAPRRRCRRPPRGYEQSNQVTFAHEYSRPARSPAFTEEQDFFQPTFVLLPLPPRERGGVRVECWPRKRSVALATCLLAPGSQRHHLPSPRPSTWEGRGTQAASSVGFPRCRLPARLRRRPQRFCSQASLLRAARGPRGHAVRDGFEDQIQQVLQPAQGFSLVRRQAAMRLRFDHYYTLGTDAVVGPLQQPRLVVIRKR